MYSKALTIPSTLQLLPGNIWRREKLVYWEELTVWRLKLSDEEKDLDSRQVIKIVLFICLFFINYFYLLVSTTYVLIHFYGL